MREVQPTIHPSPLPTLTTGSRARDMQTELPPKHSTGRALDHQVYCRSVAPRLGFSCRGTREAYTCHHVPPKYRFVYQGGRSIHPQSLLNRVIVQRWTKNLQNLFWCRPCVIAHADSMGVSNKIGQACLRAPGSCSILYINLHLPCRRESSQHCRFQPCTAGFT
jgi:hypothetical protein